MGSVTHLYIFSGRYDMVLHDCPSQFESPDQREIKIHDHALDMVTIKLAPSGMETAFSCHPFHIDFLTQTALFKNSVKTRKSHNI